MAQHPTESPWAIQVAQVGRRPGLTQDVDVVMPAPTETKISREHHDHGLFIAFAPANDPKIAVAVLKENGGFGALAAAPIAREMLDYWITGENRLGLPAPSHLSHVPPGTAQRRQGAAK